MYHIVYLSFESLFFTAEMLEELLAKSRKNNSERDITGLLMYMDGCFLQILEGEKDNVMDLYNKIQKDTRHKDVLTISKGNTEERIFAEWSMGFKTMDMKDYREMIGFTDLDNETFINEVLKTKHPKIAKTISIFYNSGVV